MGEVVPAILQLLRLCVIGFVFMIQGSAGYNISPSPAVFSEIPPVEETPGPAQQRGLPGSNEPSPESQPSGSNLRPLPASPPITSAPQTITGLAPYHPPSAPIITPIYNTSPPPSIVLHGHAPSLLPINPVASPPYNVAPPPLIAEGHVASLPPNAPQTEAPVRKTPVPVPGPPETPLRMSPKNSPVVHPNAPETSPSVAHQINTSSNGAPVPKPIAPVATPPKKLGRNQPAFHPIAPAIMPSVSPVPVVSPMGKIPQHSPAIHPVPGESPSSLPGTDVSHAPNPSPSINWEKYGSPVAAPPDETPNRFPSVNHSPTKAPDVADAPIPSPSNDWENDGSPVTAPPDETPSRLPSLKHSPTKAPSTHKSMRHSNDAPVPSPSSSKSPMIKGYHSPASSPSIPFHKHSHARNKISSPAPASSYTVSSPSKQQGPAIPPSFLPTNRQTYPAPAPGSSAPALQNPFPKQVTNVSHHTSPSPTSGWTKMPVLSPKVSPSGSSSRSPKIPHPPPVQAFPPPPPNDDCSTTVCMEPYTNTPPGSPCGCVLPMQVGLRLTVALYTFFPLVSELAQEIASGVFMKQSQVRIMGANAASQEPEKTIVLIDLVPLGKRFDNTTAFLTYQRFWHKQVVIKVSYFGEYEVLYVRYPGLPPSPPMAPSNINMIDGGPYSANDNNARTMKPLGVDVQKRHHKDGLGGGMIAIIGLSAFIALVLFTGVAWLLLRNRDCTSKPAPALQPLPPSAAKPSGTTGSMIGSGLSSASLSFGSSIPPYTGSAKTYSASDLERATSNFDASRILGEGGFGRVYSGILDDGTKVAVKVLKRDDQQGGREFLAEVEMLSRLHHRNLVKLIGICTEDRTRSLIYELIPNGSVESHLHGVDKESAPLDWDARIKIALGAARGLAYLHEDSSPRVIHRDFKSSNILLEHDFTPKVSDFGLARTALDEENKHISTRVMGTFGYVAPEYAMTGHLLVKSDVYSYGVVLLELLSGRKPVNMSQPPGQENLVAWARPLLTSNEGLKTIIDPSLGPDVPFDSVAKVAAIASMCVQPEVSNRPFMGEVVQALKLVSNECDEAKEEGSRSSTQDLSIDVDAGVSAGSGKFLDPFHQQSLVPNYHSEPDIETGLSMSGLFSTSARYGRQTSGSFRRYSCSGPLRTGGGRQLWQRMRRLTGESASEHSVLFRLWPGSH